MIELIHRKYLLKPESKTLQYEYECKTCKEKIRFFMTRPTTCYVCNTPLPLLLGVKNSLNVRVHYHLRGGV
jgi:hypothetical protein